MAIPVKVVEQPVEIRAPGDSSTVRRANRAAGETGTHNGATPGCPFGYSRTSPGSNASQPGNQRWPRG